MSVSDRKKEAELGNDLPNLAAPARRALARAGLARLVDFTAVTEAEVIALHGMGPNAMKTLKAALAEKGLVFRNSANNLGE